MILLSCGIDVHYGNSNFHFINEETRKEYYRVVPTERSHIATMLEEFKDQRIQYAFETGTMARFMYGVLSALPNTEKIHVVHPKKFKVIVESKHKNDKIDSKKLAEGLSKDYLPMPVYMKSGRCRRLQMLLHLRRSRVKNKVATVMQAKSIIRSLGIRMSGVITKKRGFERLVASVLERLIANFTADLDAIDELESEIREMVQLEFAKENCLSDSRGSALRKKFYRIAMKEKNTKKAIVAIARHLTRIVYGVLKSTTPYSGDGHA
jgi:hypothetical protein